MGKEIQTLYDTTPVVRKDHSANATTRALAGGDLNGDLKRISFKGSVFRMIVGGEEIEVSESRSMEIAIIKAAPSFIRTYYSGVYVDGKVVAPDCWSDDNLVPSPNCKTPASDKCSSCNWNVKGSSNDGKGRACRYGARMAIALGGNIGGDMFGMQIAATSVFGKEEKDKFLPMAAYVRRLDTHDYDVTEVITEMKFDTDSPVPKLMFRPLRKLSKSEAAACAKHLENEKELEAHIGPRKFDFEVDDSPNKDNGFVEEKKPEPEPEPEKVASKSEKPVVNEAAESILDEWADDD